MQATPIVIQGTDYEAPRVNPWFSAFADKLSGTLITPDNTSTKLPAVVFYHGMPSASKPRYVERAKKLAEQGIAALCFDFRGCGESDGKLGEISMVQWFEDALLAYDYLAEQSLVDTNRIGISGKSFGGYMGALVSEKRRVKSMALQAPAVYPDEWFDKPYVTTKDVQKQRLEYRKSQEALNNRAIAAIKQYTNPLLVIGSELDNICPRQVVEGYVNNAASTKKGLLWIKGADHSLRDEKHNKAYTQFMVDWFKKTL